MNAGKIVSSAGKSVELKQCAGLFDCLMEHKVAETTATFNWTGPKIKAEMWQQVLAFFRWSQVNHKSEAQVRLFVHAEHGWLAWAFPQEGGTSLSTKEIDNEAAKTQRANLIPPGYVAFGTIHHHCNISAFQSGTDRNDEEKVDGLHITIGDLEKPKYSMDARLYLKGNKFEPNLGAFWEISAEHQSHILWMADMGYDPEKVPNHISKHLMCLPAPEDQSFPQLWIENYIIKKIELPSYQHQHNQIFGPGKSSEVGAVAEAGLQNHSGAEGKAFNRDVATWAEDKDAAKILEQLIEYIKPTMFNAEDLYEAVSEIGDGQKGELYYNISTLCEANKVQPYDLFKELLRQEIMEEQRKKRVGSGPTNGEVAWGGWEGYGG
jgi:hypothetical protein